MDIMFKKLLTEPLIHFICLSLIIFLIYDNNSNNNNENIEEENSPSDNYTIIVSEERVEQIKNNINLKAKRDNLDVELDVALNLAIERYALNEIYLREARALDLGKGDRVVENRLREKMTHVVNELALIKEPTSKEIETYYQSNINRYVSPLSISFKQAFVSTDVEEAILEKKLQLQSQRINNGIDPISEASPLETKFTSHSIELVEKTFGRSFSQQLIALPTQKWVGPIDSDLAKHYIFISSITRNQPKVLQSIKNTVIKDWQLQQTKLFKVAYEKELKQRYFIKIETIETNKVGS